ncbi:hypothetical protein Tco_0814481 [Tanacetum coccineum]
MWGCVLGTKTKPIDGLLVENYATLLDTWDVDNSKICDEVSYYALFRALGWLLEEIHVTLAHLEKKRTGLQHYIQVDEKLCFQSVETASKICVAPFGPQRDGVRIICDGVWIVADSMIPRRIDEATASGKMATPSGSCAGSDTRPPMLDRLNLSLGNYVFVCTVWEKNNGESYLRPERDRVFADLMPKEKEMFKANIRDNVKMLLEGSELTKDERESQFYNAIEHFRQNKGESIHEYYVRFIKLINNMRNIKMTMPKMQLNSKLLNNMLPEWGIVQNVQARQNKVHGIYARDLLQLGMGEFRTEWDKMLLMQAQENGADLDEEQLLFIVRGETNTFDDDVDEAPVQTMAPTNNIFWPDDILKEKAKALKAKDNDPKSITVVTVGLTDSPCGGLFKLLHSGLIISPHIGLIKPLHSDLSGLPGSSLLNPPLSGLIIKPDTENMANENVLAHAPATSNEQILPFNAWVPIGKSNYVLNLQNKQKNPIFQISMDILQNINFFRAFTASASVLLDEDWFTLNANLLSEALEITPPIDQAHQFVSPPSGDAIMDFVNELGYPEEIHFVSRMVVNNLYQPWRAILSMINQSIQTFLADKANLGIATKKNKKIKPHVIPYYRFTKIIICYLGGKHNINQRSRSPFNIAEDDLSLVNLKFVPKGEEDEVFGMQIPKELITNNIRNAPYYNAYMEMVAKHDHKIASEEGGKKKSASKADQSKKPATAKQPKPVSSKQPKPAPAKQPKPIKEKSTKPSPVKKAGKGIVRKVRKGKSSLQLVDKPDEEPQPAPVGGVDIHEPVAETIRQLLLVEGKGKAVATEEQAALSLLDLHTPKKKNAEIGVDTDKMNSKGDTEILNIGEEQEEAVSNKVNLEEKTAEINEGQAGSDPGKTP